MPSTAPEPAFSRVSHRLLILGGTSEAAALARGLAGRFAERVDVVTSLAGRLPRPPALPGRLRVGGFGGAAGLADYLGLHGINLLIDATHPFASAISWQAARACDLAGVPRLMLVRRPWRWVDGDRWTEVADAATAAARLPSLGRRAFLTIGSGGLDAFAGLDGVHCLVRLFNAPGEPLPLADYAVIVGRPPFSVEDETALLGRHSIDVLVTKNSGGDLTAAKLAAARILDVTVLVIERPALPDGEQVADVAAALDWTEAMLDQVAGGVFRGRST